MVVCWVVRRLFGRAGAGVGCGSKANKRQAEAPAHPPQKRSTRSREAEWSRPEPENFSALRLMPAGLRHTHMYF
eukprot:scaffold3599_cov51-Skeletonema_menzelii.AAC.1